MNTLHKRPFALLCLAACIALGLSVASAHGQNALETIRARGKILVATDINAPPFGYLDEQARQAGSDVDAAKLLAQDLGVALEIVPVIGQNRIPHLLSRKVDIVMASFSISEERQKVIDFSDPVGVVSVLLAGPAAVPLADWSDLAGHSVATARGTMPDIELTRGIRAHQVPSVTVVRYEDDASATTAILTGQQRFAAVSSATLSVLKKTNPALDLEAKIAVTNFPYAIGLRKNEPELRAYLNTWIKTHIQNGKLNINTTAINCLPNIALKSIG